MWIVHHVERVEMGLAIDNVIFCSCKRSRYQQPNPFLVRVVLKTSQFSVSSQAFLIIDCDEVGQIARGEIRDDFPDQLLSFTL